MAILGAAWFSAPPKPRHHYNRNCEGRVIFCRYERGRPDWSHLLPLMPRPVSSVAKERRDAVARWNPMGLAVKPTLPRGVPIAACTSGLIRSTFEQPPSSAKD